MQLQTQLLAISIGHDVNVTLFTNTDLIAEWRDNVSFGQRFQGQVVVPHVR